MNRRGFFGLLGAAAATVIAPELAELLVPTRTIFLPPAGGWIGRGNQLLTIEMIQAEALRILEMDLTQAFRVHRAYDPSFAAGNRTATINIRKPPPYHRNAFQFTTADLGSAPNDRITFGGKSWPS